jgi:hypothetical protein
MADQLSNAKMDEQWFRHHIDAWRRTTEAEGIYDRATKNWKEKGDEFIKDPNFQEFVNSGDVEKKRKLLEENSFYGEMGIEDYNFEDYYGHIYKELIVNIAPQYEDKDRFGFGTNKHLPTYKDKLEINA